MTTPTPATRTKVLLVDDHDLIRKGLRHAFERDRQFEVVGEAATAAEGVRQAGALQPDVVIMDLRLPRMNGVEAITRIREESPGARIVVLTTFDGDEDIYRALQAGARGYLLKGMDADDLTAAIRSVHAGKSRIPTVVAERLAERMSGSELTARELDVLRLIVQGRSNREIAADLHISEATVKTHINNLLSKLGVSDRTQAATTALQRGLVHLE